jgi:competence protein ComEC
MDSCRSTLPRTLPGPWAAAAFASGIITSRLAVPPDAWLILATLLLVATCCIARAADRTRRAKLVLWTLAISALGGWRASSLPGEPIVDGQSAIDDKVSGVILRVRGRVIDAPILRHDSERGGSRSLLFTVRALENGSVLRARVNLGENEATPDLGVHDTVELTGRLWTPRPRRNPGDRERRRGDLALPTIGVSGSHGVRAVDVSVESTSDGTDSVRELRYHLHETIERLYGPRARGIVMSILLGDRRLLERDLRDDLVATGTFHFLAISGLHVGVVMLLILRIPLPRGGRTLVRLGLLAVFALLTGGHVPVLRAALMVAVHVLLTRIGRRPRPLNVLGWAAVLFLAIDPRSAGDPGFQLSFVAVASILLYAGRIFAPSRRPEIESLLPRPTRSSKSRRLRRFLRPLVGALAVSIASSAATAPLILYHFQRFHPLAPIWSLIVYPFVLAVLLGAIASVALGAVLPALGAPLAFVVEAAVEMLSMLLETLAEVPGSSLRIPRPSLAMVVASYLLLLLGCCSRLRRPGIGVAAFALAALVLVPRDEPRQRVVHLDVGGANTTCVETPGFGIFLVDAGVGSSALGRGLVDSILALGHRRIDGVFLSHPHRDHVGALPRLLDELDVRTVWVSTRFSDTADGRRILADLARRHVPVERLRRGDALSFPGRDDFFIEVVFPDDDEALPLASRPNDMSLGLRLRLADRRFLFLGDLEEQGIVRLLEAQVDLRADVLILPHHGRRNERFGDLVARVAPEEIVISGDGRGGGAKIVTWLRRRGYAVYPTWEGGAVVHERSADGWRSRWWRASSLIETRPRGGVDTEP